MGGHRVVPGACEPTGHVLDVGVDAELLGDDHDGAACRHAAGFRKCFVARHGAIRADEVEGADLHSSTTMPVSPVPVQYVAKSGDAAHRRFLGGRPGHRGCSRSDRPAETAKTAETAECADTDTDTGDAESVAGQPEAAGAPSPGHDVPSEADEQHTDCLLYTSDA